MIGAMADENRLDLERVAPAINGALVNGTPVVMAYVDADGKPHLSFRGTAQVLDAQTMAVWARNPEGGLPGAVAANPNVSLMYRDGATRTTYIVTGRAHVDDSDEMHNRVYDNSPEFERALDPERKGKAVVIDVDTVQGRDAGGPFRMQRSG
jgi:hypothetical protein